MLTTAIVSLSLLAGSDTPIYASEMIFPPEDFHNHSSSVVETADGDLIACWFHGRGERTDDTLVIRGARKNRGKSAWSAPFVMADNQDLPDQNCTLFIDPDGRLWLFWISSLDNEVRSFLLKYRYSTDYRGKGPPVWTWQDVIHCRPKDAEAALLDNFEVRLKGIENAEYLTDDEKSKMLAELEERRPLRSDKLFQRLGWMTRQPPLMLSDKRMMLGLYSDTFDCSMFAFTEDAGKNWQFSRPLAQFGIQPSVAARQNGDLVAFMRDSPRTRCAASRDGGMTWNEVPLDILNSGSSVAVLGLNSGNWILAVNDLPRGRYQLSLYVSEDEGRTWTRRRYLEKLDPKQGRATASYPTLIQAADGTIHVTYSFADESKFRGATIKHAWFNEAWVLAGNANTDVATSE